MARPIRRRKPTATAAPAKNGGSNRVEIIVNVSNRETRIAMLEDGDLMEYRVERTVVVGKGSPCVVCNAIDTPRSKRRATVCNVKAKV